MVAADPSAPADIDITWTDERIAAIVGWTLVRAYWAFVPRLAEALGPAGVSPTHFGVLVQLDNSPGSSQAALARRCSMTPQSMGELLPALEADGLVVRGRARGRGHPIPVYLTPAGTATLRRATPAVVELNSPEALGLDPDEQATLNRLLMKIAEGPPPR
jgi:DNA-binding MarR family transcriptional regulator